MARGEAVPEMPDEELPATDLAESDEDSQLTDDELLAKYELEDPETIEDEAKLDTFLEGKFPDRIRQMALRRMWRLNPMFRFADEMVEYGENYTDAATVIDGMTTAYQVGKGYLQKAFDAVDETPSEEVPETQNVEPASEPDDAPEVDEEPAEEQASAADEEASEAGDESNRSAEQNQLPATESVKVDETTIDEAARPAR
ncbi:MAG: DUF3306 domain-containing protein, partial [Pseudomonadota bacterium]|nr:DUF3306 domain-containing protein [Pseudomonadota bacterium]